jgi:hypothetical protein
LNQVDGAQPQKPIEPRDFFLFDPQPVIRGGNGEDSGILADENPMKSRIKYLERRR